MDKPVIYKMATTAKPITREQLDELLNAMQSRMGAVIIAPIRDYADQRDAIIDRMTKHISSTCICCPILGIGTCPRDAEQCPETVNRYFAEGK